MPPRGRLREPRRSSLLGTRGLRYGIRRMTRGKLARGISSVARRKHDAVSLAGVLASLHHPFIAFAVQGVIQLHPGIAILDAKLDRSAGGVALKCHSGNVHVHGRHIQPGLRLARVQVLDYGLPYGLLILNILSPASRQQQGHYQQRPQYDSFHSTDYTCPPRFAVTLPYDGAL
jgi:hypothetical protein